MLWQKARIFFWFLLIATAPFSVRKLIVATEPFQEYLSVFLYISDCALILFALANAPAFLQSVSRRSFRWFLVAVPVLGLISLAASGAPVHGVVAFGRLALLIIAALAAGELLRDKRVLIGSAVLIGLLAFIFATVGIMQFTAQSAIGLKSLGESPISVLDPGTAKVHVEGVSLLRAYSLMPDPNMLAGFLLVGLCALAYLFLAADKGLYVDAFDPGRSLQANARAYVKSPLLYARFVLAAAFFVVSMGLVFTFSRSGWIATTVALCFMVLLHMRISVRATMRLIALLVICSGALLFFFSQLILPRAHVSTQEPSFSYRVEYSRIGSSQVIASPLVGVGIGNGVGEAIKSGRYAERGMSRVWEQQPVHNLYLLVASEVGLVGALSFVVFLAIVMWRLVKMRGIEAAFGLATLAGLLVFGLFDHFLWDLQPGRLMLWVAIALVLTAEKEKVVLI